MERVGEIESHSAQLGRLATHLELTRFELMLPYGQEQILICLLRKMRQKRLVLPLV